MLDAASRISIVDENRLRDLCSHGIPDLPAWLRIRAWGILLGTLPKDKSLWTTAKEKEKGDYLGLAEQLLGVLSNMPPPSTPLVPQDRSIHQFAKDIESLPTPIRDALLHHGDSNHSPDGHLIAIRHGDAVSNRITQLKGRSKVSNLPSESSIPSITLDNPPLSPEKAQTFSEQQSVSPTTVLLPSSLITNPTAVYEDTILRLLYVHSSVHALHAQPMGPSPALAAIFAVVLDVALRAHNSASLDMVAIEAEVFWLVEAIVGKVMELLEPEEEKDSWAAKFSKMTRWADQDLWIDLVRFQDYLLIMLTRSAQSRARKGWTQHCPTTPTDGYQRSSHMPSRFQYCCQYGMRYSPPLIWDPNQPSTILLLRVPSCTLWVPQC